MSTIIPKELNSSNYKKVNVEFDIKKKQKSEVILLRKIKKTK